MDFNLTPQEAAFRDEVRAFLDENLPPGGPRDAEVVADFQRKVREKRWVGFSWPEEVGGGGGSLMEQVILKEEMAHHRAPALGTCFMGLSWVGPAIIEYGTAEQKQKFVPPTIKGETAWCQGYSEPGSGSDLASLKTRGELVGDEWVINGQKIWTSGAKTADYMFCLTRTEPEQPKHAGISYLLIDMKQPGIDVRPLRQMTGGADFCEVFFDDVRTPKDWIVGKRGEGWLVSRTTLKHERNSIGSTQQTRAQFAGLVALAKQSKIDGKPATEDPGIRQRLASVEGYVTAHHHSGYRTLTKDAKGESPGNITMMNKLISTNIGHDIARLAMDLIGDNGLLGPGARSMAGMMGGTEGWISQYMYSLGIAVAGGTANIQRNVIGERGLGLPRDAAAERSSGK